MHHRSVVRRLVAALFACAALAGATPAPASAELPIPIGWPRCC